MPLAIDYRILGASRPEDPLQGLWEGGTIVVLFSDSFNPDDDLRRPRRMKRRKIIRGLERRGGCNLVTSRNVTPKRARGRDRSPVIASCQVAGLIYFTFRTARFERACARDRVSLIDYASAVV